MKTGPGRNSNSVVRWLKIDAPVTSDGHQVRGELHSREPRAGDRGERPRDQRLGEARVVLDQHVAVSEQRAQRQLQRRALSHHGPLDLVEDARRPVRGGLEAELFRRFGHGCVAVVDSRARRRGLWQAPGRLRTPGRRSAPRLRIHASRFGPARLVPIGPRVFPGGLLDLPSQHGQTGVGVAVRQVGSPAFGDLERMPDAQAVALFDTGRARDGAPVRR